MPAISWSNCGLSAVTSSVAVSRIHVSDQEYTLVHQDRETAVWPIMKRLKAIGIVSTTPLSNPDLRAEWNLSCMEFSLILVKGELISVLEFTRNGMDDTEPHPFLRFIVDNSNNHDSPSYNTR